MGAEAQQLAEDPNLDEDLATRQLQALEKIEEYRLSGIEDAKPHVEGKPYHSNPKIRALQLVAEGRIGGWQGGGKPGVKKKSAGALISEWARQNKVKEMKDALDRGLASEDEKVAVQTVGKILDIETKDLERRLREQEIDLEAMNREQLIVAFFEVLNDPATQRAIEGSLVELPEATGDDNASDNGWEEPQEGGSEESEDSTVTTKARAKPRVRSRNGRGRSKASHPSRKNPFKEAARRRSPD